MFEITRPYEARSGERMVFLSIALLACIATVNRKDAEWTRFALIECAALNQANSLLKRR